MDQELVTMILRTILIYFVVLVIMRLMGKREIGKLSIFDFVVSLMIAEIAVFAVEDPKMPFIQGITPIFILMLIQVILSYLSLKSRRLREIIDGRSAYIIEKGKLNQKEMAKTRYSLDDLLVQLREKNITNLADVEFAVLEPTGKLSVIKKPEKQAATKEDIGISNPYAGIPMPLILDGQVMDHNLEKIGKNRLWLKQKIKKFGTTDFKKVFFASIDERGNMFIDFKGRI